MQGAFDWIFEAVASSPLKQHQISNYPNPFSKTTTIYLNGITNQSLDHLEVYDAIGKQCAQVDEIPLSNEIIFDRGTLPAGIYTYILYNKQSEILGTGTFVIE
jgi:hypothetical protein